MIVRKGYRFRIYPTPEQEVLFRRTIGACRFVRNLCLEQKVLERHRSQPRSLSAWSQGAELGALKAELPWLREVPHHALVQAIADLHKGFKAFFEGRTRFPQYLRKGEKESFRLPDPKQFRVKDDAIFLPKAGWVAWVRHREIAGVLKNVTISRSGDHWYASVQTEAEVVDTTTNQGATIGIDLGVAKPITLSDGTVFALPRVSTAERRHLAAAQKRMARRKKGSKNREKARRQVARIQAKWARRRNDAAHKATTMIAKNHGVIVMEDLKVANMARSARGTVEAPGRNVRQKAGLNRALLDISFGQIRSLLAYKAPLFGSRLIVVDPRNTSRTCPACGAVDAMSRKTQGVFSCVACGHADDADVNAAINILAKGQAMLNQIQPEDLPGMACGSSRTSGRKQEEDSREGRSPVL